MPARVPLGGPVPRQKTGIKVLFRKLTLAGMFSVLALLGDFGAALAEPIGEVTQVRSTAYGTPPDSARAPKRIDDPVVFKERIETLSFSALEADLNDGSVVTLGASAQVVLDEFVYDPGAATNGLLINMAQGSLRFVTGDRPKESFRLQTPTATLAIRGTNFRVRVRPNGDTLIVVDEGLVLVTVVSTGQIVEVREGQSIEIKRFSEQTRTTEGSESLFSLENLFQKEEVTEPEPNPGVLINGRLYYDRIEYNPDFAFDVGNPVVDFGWDNVAVTGVGDKYINIVPPPPSAQTPGDHPDAQVQSEVKYGGDGCECNF